MALQAKLMVISAFSAQLLVVIPITYRLMFVHDAMKSHDATLGFTNSIIATQIVMHFSIMAATFPCFRQFLKAFDSGLGATANMDIKCGDDRRPRVTYVLECLNTEGACQVNNPHQTRLRPGVTAEFVSTVTVQSSSSIAAGGAGVFKVLVAIDHLYGEQDNGISSMEQGTKEPELIYSNRHKWSLRTGLHGLRIHVSI